MKEEIKQTIQAISEHPKATVVVTGFFASNVWLDYAEPTIKALTSIVGLAVLIALLIKHVIDIKSSLNHKED